MNEELLNRAMGCLLGACCGDAVGATLEFIGQIPTTNNVKHAFTMPGGGVWNVAPGQITDDGELTICLARALSESSEFDIEKIVTNYNRWVKSNPFDIGTTTRNSLGCVTGDNETGKSGYTVIMKKAASDLCMDSMANGSLMRATP